MPSIRARNLKDITEKLETYKSNQGSLELHERVFGWWLARAEIVERKIESREGSKELVNMY